MGNGQGKVADLNGEGKLRTKLEQSLFFYGEKETMESQVSCFCDYPGERAVG